MKSSALTRYLIALPLLFLLFQCRKVSPQPPKAVGFDPPLPLTASYVAGSIIFPLHILEDKINQELDPVLVGKGVPGSVFPLRIARSGPVRIQYINQQVRLSAPLQLWVAKPFSHDTSPPAHPFCALDVNFQSPLNVTPNWRLASHIKFTNYEWIKKPEIRLLGNDIEFDKLFQKLLQRLQPRIESTIDSSIYRGLRLDQIVRPTWEDLHKPLRISKEYGLWLLPGPVAVESSPITGDTKEIIAHLRITFKTRTELKLSQPAYAIHPLPALKKRDHLPSTSYLELMSALPYADINRVLAHALAQKTAKLAFGTITVTGISVYGAQRSLIVKTNLSGLLNGEVYLRGRPVFDTLTNTLMVKNLDFDTDTGASLPGPLGSLVHTGLVKLLQELLTIQLADDIGQFPNKIGKAFAKGGTGKKATLMLQGFRFRPQQVAIQPNGIQALIRVESNVAVRMKKL